MNFEAKRIQRTGTFQTAKSPKQVFPLLCPERELDWLPGWEYEMIFSQSGFNEEGCIFKSRKPLGTETIWTTVKYDPASFLIEFLNVSPGFFVEKFNISLAESAVGGTECIFDETFTGISEAGNRLIEQATGEIFQKTMIMLGNVLNYYLETGKKMGEAGPHEANAIHP